jgi:hypothetical protein
MLRATITLTRYRESNELIFMTLGVLEKQEEVEAIVLIFDQNPDSNIAAFSHSLGTGNIDCVGLCIYAVGAGPRRAWLPERHQTALATVNARSVSAVGQQQ